MIVAQLPQNIWTEIIQQVLLNSSLAKGLKLRHVSRQFNDEVLRSLFVLQIKQFRQAVLYKRVPRNLCILQLQGFFAKRSCEVEEHEIARNAILRVAGLKARQSIDNTCFSYHPNQQCLATIDGSSRVRCKAHDLMDTMICALGYEIFVYGRAFEGGYTGAAPKDIQYWQLLLSCYWNDQIQVREQLHDLMADPLFSAKLPSIICDCFMVATRRNCPSLINLLYEEVKDRDDILEKLASRSADFNALVEALKLNYVEVFETLLQWGWRFVEDRHAHTWSYVRFLRRILTHPMEKNERETLFHTMLTRTDKWRKAAEMKTMLQFIGRQKYKRLLDILVEVLKTQHFFPHEPGHEGSFADALPLEEFCESDCDLEMVRIFLENRKLMLPHTTDAKDMEMRRRVIRQEIWGRNKSGNVNGALLKIIVEHSQDLIEEKFKLQHILAKVPMKNDGRCHEWSWLALKLGLDSTGPSFANDSNPPVAFGSVLLDRAVLMLDTGVVRFLVDNGCKLAREAKAMDVEEDDKDRMERLNTVRKLLTGAGQGRYKQFRVLETTFLPLESGPAKRSFYLKFNKPKKVETLVETTKADGSASSPGCWPRFTFSRSDAKQKRCHKVPKSTMTWSSEYDFPKILR